MPPWAAAPPSSPSPPARSGSRPSMSGPLGLPCDPFSDPATQPTRTWIAAAAAPPRNDGGLTHRGFLVSPTTDTVTLGVFPSCLGKGAAPGHSPLRRSPPVGPVPGAIPQGSRKQGCLSESVHGCIYSGLGGWPPAPAQSLAPLLIPNHDLRQIYSMTRAVTGSVTIRTTSTHRGTPEQICLLQAAQELGGTQWLGGIAQ